MTNSRPPLSAAKRNIRPACRVIDRPFALFPEGYGRGNPPRPRRERIAPKRLWRNQKEPLRSEGPESRALPSRPGSNSRRCARRFRPKYCARLAAQGTLAAGSAVVPHSLHVQRSSGPRGNPRTLDNDVLPRTDRASGQAKPMPWTLCKTRSASRTCAAPSTRTIQLKRSPPCRFAPDQIPCRLAPPIYLKALR